MRVWEDDSNCHSPFDQKIIIVQLRAIWLPAFRAVCLNRVSVLFPAKKKCLENCVSKKTVESMSWKENAYHGHDAKKTGQERTGNLPKISQRGILTHRGMVTV